ncbi:hypothetical protein LJC14_06195 [Treponema sp. OttesenSCG-928-L16]|nr:hypothetical protein [Treponema sp. OttesenSCG-928-L16]
MKKALIIGMFFLVLLGSLSAQFIHDPNDRIYTDLDRWSVRGYITSSLPLTRPYPAQLLDELLLQVMDKGDDAAVEKAEAYKDAIARGNKLIHVGVVGHMRGEDTDASIDGAFVADGMYRFRDWLSASYSYHLYGATKNLGKEIRVPGTYSPYSDFVSDWANVGPLNIYQNWLSTLGLGSADIYFQAGLNRTSFGPFYENGTVISADAGKGGHFHLNFRRPKWNYELLWLELIASDNLGDDLHSSKHLRLHSLSYRITPNLEIGFMESVMWGPRIEPLYLIPFTNLFAAQSLGDFGDNSFLGMHVRWMMLENWQLLFQLYVDDLHFNDLIRFQFNTKYKLSGQLGANWTPEMKYLSSLSADYTLVFPYMYTHTSSNSADRYGNYDDPLSPIDPEVNYVNYSHMGRNLGGELQPNSDRISIRTRWKTFDKDLNLTGRFYFTRHGNASASRIGDDPDQMNEDNHDGSIFDDGKTNDGDDNNYRKLHFLTQSVLDMRLGVGFGFVLDLPLVVGIGGVFAVNLDYVLEYGWNRELKRGNDGFTNYWSLGGSYRW